MSSTTREPAERIQLLHEPSRSRRHWLLVPLLAVVAAAAAFVWTEQNPRDWTSSAEILVTPIAASDDTFLGVPALRQSGDTARTVQTAAGLVDSAEAARRAASQLGGGWTEQRVRDRTSVQARGASTLLAVTATTSERANAVRVANAYAEAALAVRREQLAGQLDAAVSQTLSQLRRFSGSTSDYADQLRIKLDSLRAAQQTGDPTLSLAQPASVTERAGAPPWMLIAAALLAGGALGLVLVMVVDALRQPRRAG